MMKCLFGTYQKDEGTIFLNGKEVSFSGPKDALENGIAMVHQELNQCLERNVTECRTSRCRAVCHIDSAIENCPTAW